MFNKNKKGFTLAETLITIGIIGIVAALTLPNVITDYNKRIYTAQMEKLYNMISNAFGICMAEQDIDNFYESRYLRINSDYSSQSQIDRTAGKFLRNYFDVKKDCGAGSSAYSNCLAGNTYKNMSKTASNSIIPFISYSYTRYHCVILSSGALVCMKPYWAVSSESYFVVDVNGAAQGPNITGRDVFYFYADKFGKIHPYSGADCTVTGNSFNYSCLNSLIDAGWKMEY